MKKFFNSPLFITLLVISALIVMRATQKPKIASEIQAAYEEVVRIAEDGGSDIEKTKALQIFAEEIASQLKTGFSAGFGSNGSDKAKEESREEEFLRIRDQISISEPKEVAGSSSRRQEYVYTLTNNSNQIIKSLRINHDFFINKELIDTKNDWVSEVKALAPGDSVSMKDYHSLPGNIPEEEMDSHTFDSVKLVVTSFDTVD